MIKVADLGVCNEFLGDDASIDQRTATGTPAFRAPETLFRDGQKVYFDGKSADGKKSKVRLSFDSTNNHFFSMVAWNHLIRISVRRCSIQESNHSGTLRTDQE